MEITENFKMQTVQALLAGRENYGGVEGNYAKSKGLSPAQYSRIKNGEYEKLLSAGAWVSLGRLVGVRPDLHRNQVVRTQVYAEIEDSIKFCQENQTSMILVDDAGIGKSICARHIASQRRNCFYVDCSQAKSKLQFFRLLAASLGIDIPVRQHRAGRYKEIKENVKYALTSVLENPLIILDEAGDLEYDAFLDLKELWNAAEGYCGWYMMGADGLRAKIESGIDRKKVGFTEIFSRFSDSFIKLVPPGTDDRKAFYAQLITDIAKARGKGDQAAKYVRQMLKEGRTLRYLDTLIKMEA